MDVADLLTTMAPHTPWIAFCLLILAGLNLPISEELVFLVSASLAATLAHDRVVAIFAGCFLGAYLSDIMVYLIGRYGGRWLMEHKMMERFAPRRKVDHIKVYFRKYGMATLFFGRFIPFGMRNIMFMSAGLGHIQLPRFMLIDLAALSATSAVFFSVGYRLGENYRLALPYMNVIKFIILGVLTVGVLVLLGRWLWTKKRPPGSKKPRRS